MAKNYNLTNINCLSFSFEINYIIFECDMSWNPRLSTKFNLNNPIDSSNQNALIQIDKYSIKIKDTIKSSLKKNIYIYIYHLHIYIYILDRRDR